jgi:hypothetical protein
MIKSYSEIKKLDTFEERFRYLMLGGAVGASTFGFDRYLNQLFYRSQEWRWARNEVIARDNGCDLGIEGHEIFSRLLIHHMNPVTKDDIRFGKDGVLNPEYLITTTHTTHNALHYGNDSLLSQLTGDRKPGDTRLW